MLIKLQSFGEYIKKRHRIYTYIHEETRHSRLSNRVRRVQDFSDSILVSHDSGEKVQIILFSVFTVVQLICFWFIGPSNEYSVSVESKSMPHYNGGNNES